MFPTWRLKLREARVAARDGRYDEAIALLEGGSLREFLPAKELAHDVAGKIVKRAEAQLKQGDSAAAWQDLAMADRLGGQSEAINALRLAFAERTLEEVHSYVVAGQSAAALDRLERLRQRGLFGETARFYQRIATLMQTAHQSALHGHFADASEALAQAKSLAAATSSPKGTMEIVRQLETESGRLAGRDAEAARVSGELHAALGREDWSAVLTAAEQMLSIAPLHAAARQARRRAWKAVGMDVTQAYNGRRPRGLVSLALKQAAAAGGRHSTRSGARSSEGDTVSGSEQANRVLLWVDAVGGFLVCLDDQIVLGQPSQGQSIGLPILADLSRRHAVIRREGGSYVIEPVQAVRIDGRELTSPAVLLDKQLIQLGESVRIRFTKPHALSATAKLVMESRHKTQPSADAVLLMADSCVLGPNAHCHVRCPEWQHDVVLYRRGDAFQCRSTAQLAVNGEARSGPVDVAAGEHVESDSFSFAWEAVV